jgi:hypothetical protein
MICRYRYCTNETDGEIKFCSEACYYAFMKVPVPDTMETEEDEDEKATCVTCGDQ